MLIGEYLGKTEPETLVKLIQYQWDEYGESLLLRLATEENQAVKVTHQLEDADEIAHIMRQAPSRSRGTDAD